MNKYEALFKDVVEDEENIDVNFLNISKSLLSIKNFKNIISGMTYIKASNLTREMDYSLPAIASVEEFNYIVSHEEEFRAAGFTFKYYETNGKEAMIISWPAKDLIEKNRYKKVAEKNS